MEKLTLSTSERSSTCMRCDRCTLASCVASNKDFGRNMLGWSQNHSWAPTNGSSTALQCHEWSIWATKSWWHNQ
eukprot:4587620-Amphidinium_carterae.1